MEELSTWSQMLMNSVQSFWESLVSVLPSIVGTIFILIVGWLLAKIIVYGLVKILKYANFDTLADKADLSSYLSKANIKLRPSELIGKFVYYILILLVIVTVSDSLGLDVVSTQISMLIAYMPKLFVALVLLVVGLYMATFIRDIIAGATSSLGIGTGKVISSLVFYVLMIMVLITSFNQAGIDTTIFTSNLLLILGAILISAAISYGFASRDVLKNILAGFFSKNTYNVGMKIEVDGTRGTIIEISTIGVKILEDDDNIMVLPTHILVTEKVRIIKN